MTWQKHNWTNVILQCRIQQWSQTFSYWSLLESIPQPLAVQVPYSTRGMWAILGSAKLPLNYLPKTIELFLFYTKINEICQMTSPESTNGCLVLNNKLCRPRLAYLSTGRGNRPSWLLSCCCQWKASKIWRGWVLSIQLFAMLWQEDRESLWWRYKLCLSPEWLSCLPSNS